MSYRFQNENPHTQSHRWCFTINNYTEADIKAIEKASVNFLVYGKEEAPSTGTPHLQGYVEFHDRKRRSAVCKALGGRAFCQTARGTAGENIEYCTKEKNYWMTDKVLEASYKYYDSHPLPDYWTKQERYEWKLYSNHENWTEEDLNCFIKSHDNHTNYLLSKYEDMTRKDIFLKDWNDEGNKLYHIVE